MYYGICTEVSTKETVLNILGSIGLFSAWGSCSADKIRVLCYHGVEEKRDPLINHDGLQLSPTQFREHLEIISNHGYRVISLGQAVASLAGKSDLVKRALVISFDDGYRNNLEQAAPILKEFGFPAVFFITTGLVTGEQRLWWYRLRRAVAALPSPATMNLPNGEHAILGEIRERIQLLRKLEVMLKKRPPGFVDDYLAGLEQQAGIMDQADPVAMMKPGEVRDLSKMGFDVEPHSHLHLSGHAIDAGTAADEISRSACLVKAWTGRSPRYYSYPFGDSYPEAESLLGKAGLEAAVTSDPGMNNPGTDPYALKRWTIKTMHTPARFEALLSGFSDAMRRK